MKRLLRIPSAKAVHETDRLQFYRETNWSGLSWLSDTSEIVLKEGIESVKFKKAPNRKGVEITTHVVDMLFKDDYSYYGDATIYSNLLVPLINNPSATYDVIGQPFLENVASRMSLASLQAIATLTFTRKAELEAFFGQAVKDREYEREVNKCICLRTDPELYAKLVEMGVFFEINLAIIKHHYTSREYVVVAAELLKALVPEKYAEFSKIIFSEIVKTVDEECIERLQQPPSPWRYKEDIRADSKATKEGWMAVNKHGEVSSLASEGLKNVRSAVRSTDEVLPNCYGEAFSPKNKQCKQCVMRNDCRTKFLEF